MKRKISIKDLTEKSFWVLGSNLHNESQLFWTDANAGIPVQVTIKETVISPNKNSSLFIQPSEKRAGAMTGFSWKDDNIKRNHARCRDFSVPI